VRGVFFCFRFLLPRVLSREVFFLAFTPLMNRFLTTLCGLLVTSLAHAAELETVQIDAETWPLGPVPKEVFVLQGNVLVSKHEGSQVLMIDPSGELNDVICQLGNSSQGETHIQAKAYASKRGRSRPKFGLTAHGMSGYQLIVNAPLGKLQLLKGTDIIQQIPFSWQSDAWLMMKLDIQPQGQSWRITGTVWPASEKEPATAQIQHEDSAFKGQGKAGLCGTPYSLTPIYFDDICIRSAKTTP
jgi:hypothetical protein